VVVIYGASHRQSFAVDAVEGEELGMVMVRAGCGPDGELRYVKTLFDKKQASQ
jgi:hypothetical protein